jgi:hypothetical protein
MLKQFDTWDREVLRRFCSSSSSISEPPVGTSAKVEVRWRWQNFIEEHNVDASFNDSTCGRNNTTEAD